MPKFTLKLLMGVLGARPVWPPGFALAVWHRLRYC